MFDRKAIMNRAWAIHREGTARRTARRAQGETFPPERKLFANALRLAWREAKDAVTAIRLEAVEPIAINPTRAAIHDLNMKTHWTTADYQRHSLLTSQMRNAA
jgi:hypothetical protein